MLFNVLVAVLSMAIALLRDGSLRKIPDVSRLWLPLVAMALQLLTILFPGTPLALVLLIASYLLLVWFVLGNWQFIGLRLLVIGLGLNMLVMGANGGRMPVDPQAMIRAGMIEERTAAGVADTSSKHQMMVEGMRFAFLGDVIPMQYPVRRVLSIGDIFVLCGIFVLVQEGMGARMKLFGSGEPK